MTASIIIKRGREKPIVNQHPWIFSGAIDHVDGNPTPGDIVTVKSHDGRFLARGYWNPKSQIQVRILTWQDEPIDDDWWRQMLKQSIKTRAHFVNIPYKLGYRLINAENDYLPGLIVDRYGEWLVLQALTLGVDLRKEMIAGILSELVSSSSSKLQGVYERSDVDVRHKEGLEQSVGVLWGENPPEYIEISDDGLAHAEPRYLVDVRKGHKTGFYLDQRENRRILDWLFDIEFYGSSSAEDVTMLNLFSYTGAFGLQTQTANYRADYPFIKVINIDSSHEILELAEEIYKLNQFPPDNAEFIQADVFDYLRDAVDRNEQYDVIVCDPPKFAHNAQQVHKAARGYKDLNLHCFRLVKPGGYLMTFSCSGAVSADLFQKIVFGALADTGRQAQILKHLGPGEDHPVALTFPEGAYLKGLLLRVY
jgi:23S rRNA (cytosine1962-C5)-methyltransferase